MAWNCTQHGIDLLRLYANHPFEYKTMVHRFLSPHSHLVRVRGWHHGSQGYLITRRSAQALMAAATTSMYAPVDWIIAGYWTFGLPAYCLFPFPLLERSVPSSVGETREEAFTMSPAQKAKYLAWKVRNRMQRAKVDASLAWQNPFPPTGDVGQAFVDRATPQPARNTQRHRQMASRSDPTRPDAVLTRGSRRMARRLIHSPPRRWEICPTIRGARARISPTQWHRYQAVHQDAGDLPTLQDRRENSA